MTGQRTKISFDFFQPFFFLFSPLLFAHLFQPPLLRVNDIRVQKWHKYRRFVEKNYRSIRVIRSANEKSWKIFSQALEKRTYHSFTAFFTPTHSNTNEISFTLQYLHHQYLQEGYDIFLAAKKKNKKKKTRASLYIRLPVMNFLPIHDVLKL